MIDKKTFFIYLVAFVQFLPGANFDHGTFKDCPSQSLKNTTNHLHLLSVSGDRKFV